MWKITKHKNANGQQELQVCIKVRELEFDGSENSTSLHYSFINRIKEIKRTNNFSADLMYGSIPPDEKTLEIWKLKADGDFNYKMFTLEYAGKNPNPFNF